MPLFSLLIQTAYASEPVIETINSKSYGSSLIDMFFQSGILMQVTMLSIIALSVVSWAIIGSKLKLLKKNSKRDKKFYSAFFTTDNINSLIKQGTFVKSPAFNVFKSGIETLRENQKKDGLKSIEREVQRTIDDEVEEMEHNTSFLAITSSVAPFLGLFGTVWGILHVFWKIGNTGASSLATIGPHIAEALLSTALGLMAAIPAVFFHYFLTAKINEQGGDLQDFAEDFIAKVEKEYF